MALKGADISATYQDWVHVNKSGAGLADHAGAEAALYLDDGAGGVDQVCGRTAVRHWLDPHPDAASFAETWEFSTKGTMTQGQLEAAGWVFDAGMSGSVSGGVFKITSSGTGKKGARLTVSYAGDFDVIAAPIFVQENTSAESPIVAFPFFAIGDADGTGHYTYWEPGGINYKLYRAHSATTSDWSGGTSTNTAVYHGANVILRISRISGTVYITGGVPNASLFGATATRVVSVSDGWFVVTTDVDAATMDVITLGGVFASGNPASIYWTFLRRFV